jgi:homoserine O-acetyltransferase
MDSHDAGRGRGGLAAALEHIKARTLVIGIQSDILFPLQEQKTLAELIPGAHHEVISSLYGHDGFLLEYTQIEQLIKGFLKESPAAQRELINH